MIEDLRCVFFLFFRGFMLIPYIFTHAYTHAPLPPHMHTFTVLLPEAHGPDALSLSQPSPLLLPTQE